MKRQQISTGLIFLLVFAAPCICATPLIVLTALPQGVGAGGYGVTANGGGFGAD
jgi:hypothetical protein